MPLLVWKLDQLGRNLADFFARLIAKLEPADLFDRSTLLCKP
jgi:hypothetical protein